MYLIDPNTPEERDLRDASNPHLLPPAPPAPWDHGYYSRLVFASAIGGLLSLVILILAGVFPILAFLIAILLGCAAALYFLGIAYPQAVNRYNANYDRYSVLYNSYLGNLNTYRQAINRQIDWFENEVEMISLAREHHKMESEWRAKYISFESAKRSRDERIIALEKWVEAGFAEAKIKRDMFGGTPDYVIAAEFRVYMLTIPNVPDWGLLRESQSPTVKLIIGDGAEFPLPLPLLTFEESPPAAPPAKVLRYYEHPGARGGLYQNS